MSKPVFYIQAVLACIQHFQGRQIVTYYVTTNAGTDVFIPALGEKLPRMVVEFLENTEPVQLPEVRPPITAYFKHLI